MIQDSLTLVVLIYFFIGFCLGLFWFLSALRSPYKNPSEFFVNGAILSLVWGIPALTALASFIGWVFCIPIWPILFKRKIDSEEIFTWSTSLIEKIWGGKNEKNLK